MGHYLVNAVLNGLSGREFSDTLTSSKGKKKPKKFGTKEVSLLVVVANGQPNPGSYGVDDTIFYSGIENLCKLTHIPDSTLFETRNFLVGLGLLDFRESETRPAVDGKPGIKTYTNVYRIVVPKIRSFFPEDAGDYWRKSILRVTDGDYHKMSTAQRRILGLDDAVCADSALHSVDSILHDAGSELHGVESKLHGVDTNIKKQKNKQKNNTTLDSAFVGADLNLLITKISDACGVEEWIIDRNIIENTVKLRDPGAVKKVIDDFSDGKSISGVRRKPAGERVGLLVWKLNKLPKLSEDEMRRVIEAQFKPVSQPEPVSQPVTEVVKKDPYENTFNQLVTAYRLNELLGYEVSAFWAEFSDVFKNCAESTRIDHLKAFRADITACTRSYDGVENLFKAVPDAHERLEIVRKILEKRHD